MTWIPVTGCEPALTTGQALGAVYPHLPLAQDCKVTNEGWGGTQGRAGSARILRGCMLWGLKASAPDCLVWRGFSTVTGPSPLGQWEYGESDEASSPRLHMQWVAAPGCLSPAPTVTPADQPSRVWHAVTEVKVFATTSGVRSVGTQEIFIFFVLCPHSTPACFSAKFNAVLFLGTRVGWLKPKPLTSSLPSRACLLPWLTVSSSPGCTSVHGGFLATGWWSLPRQDVYLP